MSENVFDKLFKTELKSGVTDDEVRQIVEDCVQFGAKLAEFALRTTDHTQKLYPNMCTAMKSVLVSLTEIVKIQANEVGYPIEPSANPGVN